ncbi:hypothetical protein JCM33374_g5290 [Metschnikowia sp. JCM 33374]|nr:hypothetical protein JCM33374_g5290 [Metschnikowia sp. JCM 33374]
MSVLAKMRTTKAMPWAFGFCLSAVLVLLLWGENSYIGPMLFGVENTEMPVSRTSMVATKHVFKEYSKWVYEKENTPQNTDQNTGQNTPQNTVLVACSIANEKSFGGGRSFADLYQVIGSLQYPQSAINLSFYCGSAGALDMVQAFFDAATKHDSYPYAKVTILYAPFLQTSFESSDHSPGVQRQRRRSIARGRNFVVLNSLDAEAYTLFLDADIVRLDHRDMLRRFVDSGNDIIVPRVERGESSDYDRNSWRGHRITPSQTQLALMDDNKWADADFEPRDVASEMFHLGDHVEQTKDVPESDERRQLSYVEPLDSVGGAVLFAKSIIYKQGVVFPPINVVGTSWARHEGYDGIETEGLCYMARPLGYQCVAMPNLVAQHYSK